ncbi:MAG: lytic transglycosylase domain-containing protein [Lentisphaerae bacterium]|nr:lytic transglycosylase domain-containing protein [Lentisphaerota bacterium]
MKSARLIPLLLASVFATSRPAFSEPGEWEIDFGQISEAGQEILDRFAPESIRDTYRFYTADELSSTFSSMQDALGGGRLDTLAGMQPRAREILESLRANPDTQGYAAWLEARMDYFEMAAEVERAIPSPVPSAPPAPALPPHPASPKPPLVPHPAESTEPAPPRKPAPPAAAPALLPPHPSDPPPVARPAHPPASPPPTVEKARNRYVESQQVWERKLANRPPPARAAALLQELKRIFREEGVPPSFVWQAEAESSFNPAARSPAGAVGLFQFMPATARQFGLRLTPDDERLDALKNARAAAKYLKILHDRFGNWPLAFAAYNCGQGRVAGALRTTGGRSFDDIHDRLPAETRMYVPKVAALIRIRENVDLNAIH